MVTVTVIGCFCAGKSVADGQSVKTKILTEELERWYGKDEVVRVDTYQWKKNPIKLLWSCVKSVYQSHNVLFLTDEGGIRVFPYLLQWVNISKRCKLHYYVVGGWLKTFLDHSNSAACYLKKLDVVYVEIPAMLRELEYRGFENGVLVNKFRRLNPVNEEDISMSLTQPFKLCFFSRVMKEKGIEDAIAAVKYANEKAGYEKFTLDIFGAVYEPYRARFEEIEAGFPSFVKYRGIVNYEESSRILKEYSLMLFPTFYPSEGYPNAVVDAYAAALPVVATRWNYNADIIHDHEDGLLVDVGNVKQLVDAINEVADHPSLYRRMRCNCLARCKEYLPEYALVKVAEKMKKR